MILDNYFTVDKEAVAETEEKRSKFIAHIKPVNTEKEALDYISSMKSKYSDATHNVYAYTVTDESSYQRYSDDGEPQGTAGLPVLEAMKKRDIINAVCVVTRYFGGVLLGAPGLVRAYGKCAACAIEQAGIVEKHLLSVYNITVDYGMYSALMRAIPKNGYVLINSECSDNVVMTVGCVKGEEEKMKKFLYDITSGTLTIEDSEKRIIWQSEIIQKTF